MRLFDTKFKHDNYNRVSTLLKLRLMKLKEIAVQELRQHLTLVNTSNLSELTKVLMTQSLTNLILTIDPSFCTKTSLYNEDFKPRFGLQNLKKVATMGEGERK